MIVKLWETFVAEDATLVEVNPLVRDPQDKVVALDGKVTLDGNADFRHPGHADLVDERTENPLEAKAKARNLNYVKLDDGQVGIIGNGAGLVMSTLDVVAYAGEKHGGVKPANFLDIGGGASAKVMADGLDVILGDPDVKSVFVNVFGGITACDAVANGIVEALKILGDSRDQAAGGAAGRQQRASRAARSWTRRTTRWSRRWTRWTTRPTRPPSSPRPAPQQPTLRVAPRQTAPGRGPDHGDLSERAQQGHRPGPDRRGGHQARHEDAGGGDEHRGRGERPQGRHLGLDRRPGAGTCRCSGRWRRR